MDLVQLTGRYLNFEEREEIAIMRSQGAGVRQIARALIAAMAEATPGVTVRRGVSVVGVVSAPGPSGVVHVNGVRTADGEEITADLVVDASGRRLAVNEWLRAAGSSGPLESVEDIGFIYYGRYFRSGDGSVPPAIGGLLQPYGSISILTLPADNGTWGVGVIASSKDAAIRALLDVDCWERVVRSFPLVAHWVTGEAITGVELMAKIEDRQHTYVVTGAPVATGIVPLADAWACTNPSLGRGLSIGLIHAAALRQLLHDETFNDPTALAIRWGELTAQTVQPHFEDTLSFDRHRLAEIEAIRNGHPYETDDPAWHLGKALETSAIHDPDLLRGFLDVVSLTDRAVDVLSRPGLADKAIALADPTPAPGPDRGQLLAIIGA